MPSKRGPSIRGTSLEEALTKGEGIERPFRCHVHDDSGPSASVNVLKGVWYCFACGAKGMTDGKGKAPSVADLESMLEPERAVRSYPEGWLELFDNDLGNWPTRFPAWVRWVNGLGCDPLTGDATFPVRTPKGKLAGVGRRRENSGDGPRFVYPPRWSAARSTFEAGVPGDIMALTEGASDAVAISETGCYANAMYGAGVHFPQIELIQRRSPRLILLAFDDDDAGNRAAERAYDQLRDVAELARVDWSREEQKDAAGVPLERRLELLLETVGGTKYGASQRDVLARWNIRAVRQQASYKAHVEEADGR
jgi:hypothetical protein